MSEYLLASVLPEFGSAMYQSTACRWSMDWSGCGLTQARTLIWRAYQSSLYMMSPGFTEMTVSSFIRGVFFSYVVSSIADIVAGQH